MRDKAANPIPVAIVVFDQVALFELGVACAVFGTDVTTRPGIPLYDVVICGPAETARTDAGVPIGVPRGLEAIRTAHTVIVPPTYSSRDAVPASVIDAVR